MRSTWLTYAGAAPARRPESTPRPAAPAAPAPPRGGMSKVAKPHLLRSTHGRGQRPCPARPGLSPTHAARSLMRAAPGRSCSGPAD